MSNPPGNKKPFHPDDRDIRVTFLLKGEEANEFRRWAHRRNLKPHSAARSLLIKGLISVNALPSWWERRVR